MGALVSRSSLVRYASLALPLAFAGLPIYMLAPDFYTVHLNLSLALVGTGLLVLRLADALIDPLLGRLIDSQANRANIISGFSASILCIGFFMLFSPPPLDGAYLAAWFFVSIFLVTLAFSAMTILYGSVGALWSGNKSEQTLITSNREAATLIGLILAVSLPFMLLEAVFPRYAYLGLALLFVLLLVPIYLYYRGIEDEIIREAGFAAEDGTTEEPAPESKVSAPSTPIFVLYLCYAISALASAIPAVLVVFFVRDYLGSQWFIGLALVIYFLSGALSMPLWHKLAERLGKHRAWQLSMCLAVVSFTWVFMLNPGDFVYYTLICFMSGAALGAEMAIPPAILSEYLQGRSGKSAAQKYAGLTMISKLALALAAGICLPLLAWSGFVAGGESSQSSISVLLILYGLVPGIMKLLAVLVLQFWIQKERLATDDFKSKSFTSYGAVSDG